MFENAPRFKAHLKDHRKVLGASALVLAAQAALVVLAPLPLKLLIDNVLMKSESNLYSAIESITKLTREPMFFWLIGIIACFGVIACILDYLEETVVSLAAARIVEGARREMVRLLLSRNFSTLEQRRKIDLLGRLSGDTANLEMFITPGLAVLVRAIPTIVLILGAMLFVDWRLSLILGVTLPLMYVSAARFSNRMRKQQKAYRSETNHFEQDSHQTLASIQLVKSLSIEAVTASAIEKRIEKITGVLLESRKSQGAVVASFSATRNIIRVLALLIGGYGVIHGSFSIGSLVLFLAYTDAIAKPINEIIQLTSKYNKAMVSLERVEALFDEMEPEAEIGGTRQSLPQRSGPATLEFRSISFGYHQSPLLLNQFSANFDQGGIIAMVGPSGAGKTTLVKLMNRLIDPTEGLILLGGADIRSYDLDYLRRKVTVISQDSFFIHGTVRENLDLAVRSEAADAEIWEALTAVNAEDFVRGLPNGLDTVIGEGGKKLSGGQMRRLSLARAFLRDDSSIYVFDEATSGLDPYSSRVVMSSVQELADRGALVFWTTHRPEEVSHSNAVMYFRQGLGPLLSTHRDLFNNHLSYRAYFSEGTAV